MPSSKQASNRGRVALWVAVVYFVAMVVGVTFPGVVPFNRVRPFVFGVPFVFAWYMAWIVGAFAALAFVYRSARP